MDEIDAAVEDAEYVRAMRDGVPQPTKGWDYMSGMELEKYLDKLRMATKDGLSIETIAGTNLGFYHFTKYLRENGGVAEANFIIAVASFRVRHVYQIQTPSLSHIFHVLYHWLYAATGRERLEEPWSCDCEGVPYG
jgi:hypothetical protein